MNIHRIRKEVLQKLTSKSALRYRDLKPADVEGNQFAYHLRKLINERLIKKAPTGTYSLTAEGTRYVQKVNLTHFSVRAQPTIVTLIVLQNTKSEYLLYKRNKMPFLGQYGFPYGKIHISETVSEAASRELEEKTGLTSLLTHKGITYLTIRDKQGELVVNLMCHIFFGKNPKQTNGEEPRLNLTWYKKESIKKLPTMNGVNEILADIGKNKNFFFKEYFLEEK